MRTLIEEIKNEFDVLCITKDCAQKNFAINRYFKNETRNVKIISIFIKIKENSPCV